MCVVPDTISSDGPRCPVRRRDVPRGDPEGAWGETRHLLRSCRSDRGNCLGAVVAPFSAKMSRIAPRGIPLPVHSKALPRPAARDGGVVLRVRGGAGKSERRGHAGVHAAKGAKEHNAACHVDAGPEARGRDHLMPGTGPDKPPPVQPERERARGASALPTGS